jgi:hypothetical protein
MGGPTSSYATAGIVVRIVLPHKPHHYVKVRIPSERIIISNTNKGASSGDEEVQ